MFVLDLALPLKGSPHGVSDFVCEIAVWMADFTLAAYLSVLADGAAFALFAVVSEFAMLADGGAFALFAGVSAFAMLAEAGAFAFFALVSLSVMLAKCLGVANGAIFLQLAMWAFLTDPSHFSDNQPKLRQVLSVLHFFFIFLYHFFGNKLNHVKRSPPKARRLNA